MPISLHRRAADVKTVLAFKETALDEKGAKESDGRVEKPMDNTCFLVSFVIGLRTQFGEMEKLFAVGLWGIVRVV